MKARSLVGMNLRRLRVTQAMSQEAAGLVVRQCRLASAVDYATFAYRQRVIRHRGAASLKALRNWSRHRLWLKRTCLDPNSPDMFTM